MLTTKVMNVGSKSKLFWSIEKMNQNRVIVRFPIRDHEEIQEPETSQIRLFRQFGKLEDDRVIKGIPHRINYLS